MTRMQPTAEWTSFINADDNSPCYTVGISQEMKDLAAMMFGMPAYQSPPFLPIAVEDPFTVPFPVESKRFIEEIFSFDGVEFNEPTPYVLTEITERLFPSSPKQVETIDGSKLPPVFSSNLPSNEDEFVDIMGLSDDELLLEVPHEPFQEVPVQEVQVKRTPQKNRRKIVRSPTKPKTISMAVTCPIKTCLEDVLKRAKHYTVPPFSGGTRMGMSAVSCMNLYHAMNEVFCENGEDTSKLKLSSFMSGSGFLPLFLYKAFKFQHAIIEDPKIEIFPTVDALAKSLRIWDKVEPRYGDNGDMARFQTDYVCNLETSHVAFIASGNIPKNGAMGALAYFIRQTITLKYAVLIFTSRAALDEMYDYCATRIESSVEIQNIMCADPKGRAYGAIFTLKTISS